ncbi:MAG TPA: tetratricopeptide repeat protein, partial [Mycobacteriales bacterium]
EEAIGHAQEAVRIRRDLVRRDPDTHQAALASSLHNLAKRLRSLGRTEEATRPAQEAAKIYRRASEARGARSLLPG